MEVTRRINIRLVEADKKKKKGGSKYLRNMFIVMLKIE